MTAPLRKIPSGSGASFGSHKPDGPVHTGEEGVVLAIVAIAGLLLVLLGIGLAVQVPTGHANAVKTHDALDVGAVHALFGAGNGPSQLKEMADSAFDNADAVLRNVYSAGMRSVYSSGFDSTRAAHSLWIPRIGRDHTSAGVRDAFAMFTCSSGTQKGCAAITINPAGPSFTHYKSFLDQVFDINGIDDFRNAVMFYSLTQPYNYLAILPERSTETLSIPRISNVMTYMLIDPAFSLDSTSVGPELGENYLEVFGSTQSSDGTNDDLMYPYGSYRKRPTLTTVSYPEQHYVTVDASHSGGNPSWTVETTDSLITGGYANKFYNTDPVRGTSMVGGATAAAVTDPELKDIYRFYAAMCDTLLFHYYKTAAVNLLDRVEQTSAFNPTTLVGLTGVEGRDTDEFRLIPIHPASMAANYAQHSATTDFPLPKNADAENRYLHSGKTDVFKGFVNSGDFDVTHTTPAPPNASGYNRPELCFCRGLFGITNPGGTPYVGYLTPEDRSGDDSGDTELNNVHLLRRLRETSLAQNWCDDDYNGTANDYSISYEQSRPAGSPALYESVRNIVATQAMRVENPHLEWISGTVRQPSPTNTWVRPIDLDASGNYLDRSNPANAWPAGAATVGQGYRYIPGALKAACQYVKDAQTAYNADNTYGKLRPTEERAVVLYAFGVYSPSALVQVGKSPSDAMDDFRDALKQCLCDQVGASVYIAFLPLTEKDRNQVAAASTIIQEFQNDHNFTCAAQTPPSGSPCDTGHASSLYAFVYDWKDSRFSNWDDSTPTVCPDTTTPCPSTAKLRAAAAFAREVSESISALMLRFVYAS